ncbi:MAG: DUF2341 domain-containing protein, partial [Lentisphaerae bacterium]|nr:DUF2341 domain-containing protein [Lentisphaerota bacterium]
MKRFCKLILLAISLYGVSAFAEDYASWQKRMPITFLGYTKSETLLNFPVLIELKETNEGVGFKYADFMSSPYNDLRFAAEDLVTPLDFEVESWNVSGVSHVWVKVPSLNSATKIYVLWGHADVSLPVSSTDGSVWSEHFTGVWHLNETSGTSVYDARGNAHPGTVMGTKVTLGVPGKIGNAFQFAGNTGYVRTELVHGTTATISGWATRDADGMMWARGQYNPDLWFYVGRIILNNGDSQNNPFGNQPANVGDWHHYVTVLDATQPKARLYVDGELASDTANYKNPSGTPPFCISSGCGYDWSGKIDEFSTASVARSADWIWASWKNQGFNSDFLELGTPVMQDLPYINNGSGATNVTSTSAWLNGTLSSTGTSATAVSVYWGVSDGGKNPSGWTSSRTWAAPQQRGDYTHELTGLSAGTTYYYSLIAANDVGFSWAPISSVFITDSVWFEKLADASEIGPVSGKVRVHRPTALKTGALDVFYTVGGTATPGDDYEELSGYLIIPSGSASADITITPFFDHFLEGTETVIITLGDGPYVHGTPSSVTVSIEDFGTITRTWTGAGANALASNPDNWVGNEAPVEGDAILLNASSHANMTWDLNQQTGSWTQDGYEGVVTINTVYPSAGSFTNLVIVGDCTITSGTWKHGTNTKTPAYWMRVSVTGNLTVGPDAKIDVTNLGYPTKSGLGYITGDCAASHGGHGWGTGAGPCYGSVTEPILPGSGGRESYGGGAIVFDVGGAIENNGEFRSDGGPSNWGGGSGGSIWLTAGSLTGSGIISANGSKAANDGNRAAGGGRISLVVTNIGADFSGYSGSNTTFSTGGGGRGGTIYYEQY